jgi:multiple sugar transport system permease protein
MAVVARRGESSPFALWFSRNLTGWIFLIPTLFFFCGWALYPIIKVLYISFTNLQFIDAERKTGSFVGLSNYITALQDPLVHLGLLRAAVFTVLFLPGTIFIPMLLAIMIDRVRNGLLSSVYRTVLLIPAVIPGPLIFVLWKWLYNFNIGPFNILLIQSGLFNKGNAPQWIGDNLLLTMSSIATMEVWWGLGYHTMFFLAGLAAIPKELFEAAKVDGANEWQMFWQITIPRLRPILLILVVLRFGSAMAVIDEYLIFGFDLSKPTYTWTVYMWDLAFQRGSWPQGYAAAVGWIGAFVVLAVVGVMFWILRDRDSK